MEDQRINRSFQMAAHLENSQVQIPAIDSIAGTPVVHQAPHHEIHTGNHFFVSTYSMLNNGNTTKITFTTPASSKRCHMLWAFLSTGPVYVPRN